MSHSYFRKAWRCTSVLGLSLLLAGPAWAQRLNYTARDFSAQPGTYTDLEATGTAIPTANTDDANSAPQEIGFSFEYNGRPFTQFVLNTNGFLRLGSQPPAAMASTTPASLFGSPAPSTDPADVDLLLPFSHDLIGSTKATPEYRVATTGTAPNRVCTIQWKNVADKVAVAHYDPMSFQVRLYESSRVIEFVYGPTTANSGSSPARAAGVGLKGSGTGLGQLVVLAKTAATPWISAKAQNTVYAGNNFGFRRTVLPNTGLTYRFEPTPPQDAQVVQVYTLGQLPLVSATPHQVKAKVANLGTAALTDVKVKLQVTGATEFENTQTVSIAVGDTALVTFAAYTPTTTGTDQVIVSTAADDRNDNNSQQVTQQVTTTRLSYADDSPLITGPTYASDTLLLARYRLMRDQAVRAVLTQVPTTPTNEGQTVYAVVLDANGQLVGRSRNHVLTAEELGKELSLTLLSPIRVAANTDFYVGLAVTTLTLPPVGVTAYEPVGLQAERPVRPDSAYFTSSLRSGRLLAFRGGRLVLEAQLMDVPACLAPLRLEASATTTNGTTLTFPAVAGATSYEVIYGERGFDPTAGQGTVVANVPGGQPYQLTGLRSGQVYDVYVRTACANSSSGYVGPTTVQTGCPATTPAVVPPYSLTFDEVLPGSLPCGVTVLNANNDRQTWQNVVDAAAGFTNALRLFADFDNGNAADDWFFTAPLQLTAGQTYPLSFRYRADKQEFAESLEVTLGSEATPAAQTTSLWKKTDITNEQYAEQRLQLVPTTTGTYYVGFHGISEKERSNLYVDQIKVEAGTTSTGVRHSLSQQLSVYPSPATSQLTVRLPATGNGTSRQVEIFNLLGQRVYQGQLVAAPATTLPIAHLRPGQYVLKVQIGNQVGVRAFQVRR